MGILKRSCKELRPRFLCFPPKQTRSSRKYCNSQSGSFKAVVLLTTSRTEDSEYEVANMRPGIGQVIAFPSIWGHWAGGPGNVEDTEWLDMKMKEFFAANRKEDVAAAVTIQVLA
jgi:hypothetical protein